MQRTSLLCWHIMLNLSHISSLLGFFFQILNSGRKCGQPRKINSSMSNTTFLNKINFQVAEQNKQIMKCSYHANCSPTRLVMSKLSGQIKLETTIHRPNKAMVRTLCLLRAYQTTQRYYSNTRIWSRIYNRGLA